MPSPDRHPTRPLSAHAGGAVSPVPAFALLTLLAACANEPSPAPTAVPALPAKPVDAPGQEARPAPVVIASSTTAAARSPASSAPVELAAPPSIPSPPGIRRYDLRFEDVTLPELVRAISEITGRRFVLSGQLPAVKASLYSPDPVTAEEAYQAFLTVLASNGLTVLPRGRFLTIVPSPGIGGGR